MRLATAVVLARHVAKQHRSLVRAMASTPAPKPVEKKEEKQLSTSILEEVMFAEKPKATTFTGKVAEKAENTFMYAAVAASIAALGAFAYVLLDTFFAADSPNKIYSRALSMIRDDPRSQDLFGESIAGFGEGKRRRNNIASHTYEKDGEKRVRVLFHIKGDRAEGNAQCEVVNRDGNWETRFLYVETRTSPKITHVIIDNR
ncbi:hypothetical protein PMAYCL1PPCAC_17021 [Pristionchus mayeri]|uniref:Mitochondrial import inner membrane translocase subunit Tim21 n=1 Tax=Pristionchus mayeri TaxID=1317129 RepID=A0AAN5CLY2_9BILA|nr:hypothetical protein PMAYCL1PPCAC_17021 [Pristionchus mayeri]